MPRGRLSRTDKPFSSPADPSLIEYLRELVHEAIAGLAGVGRKKMLVSIGYTVNDRVFALVSRQARIVIRIPDEVIGNELLAIEGAERWQIGTRAPMKDWLLLPEAAHDDSELLTTWLRRAWELGREAPPKRARKAPAKRTITNTSNASKSAAKAVDSKKSARRPKSPR